MVDRILAYRIASVQKGILLRLVQGGYRDNKATVTYVE